MLTTILYIGRDTEITAVMNRLLNARPEWKGLCVCKNEEAISICKEQHIEALIENDIVTTGDDMLMIAREELSAYRRNPESAISFDELKTLFKNSD